MNYFNGHFPFHTFSFFFIIFFWGVVIYGIYFLLKQIWNPEKQSAIHILKERYVKWEITREEFESMKKDIK